MNKKMKRFVREQTEQKVKPSRILNQLIDSMNLETVEGLLSRIQRLSSHYRRNKMNDSNDIAAMQSSL